MPENNYQQIISVVTVGTIITLLVVSFLVSFVYLYQKRHFKYLKEKELLENQFREELLKTQLEIQEQTFRTISEEIHDNIGQALSFIKLNINTISATLPTETKEQLLESKSILTRVIQDLRDLSKTLNTDYILELGIAGAIERQLSFLEKTGNYKIAFQVIGKPDKYPIQQELILYRVVQELLNNIVKHADASEVKVAIRYLAERMIVQVDDNGVGFDAGLAYSNKNGLGINNMINRMSLLKGKIEFASSQSHGTSANIELPKNNNF